MPTSTGGGGASPQGPTTARYIPFLTEWVILSGDASPYRPMDYPWDTSVAVLRACRETGIRIL